MPQHSIQAPSSAHRQTVVIDRLIRRYDAAVPGPLCDALIEQVLSDPQRRFFDDDWRRCYQSDVRGARLAEVRSVIRQCFADYRGVCATLNFCTQLERPTVIHYEPLVGEGADKHHFHEHSDAWTVGTATRQISVIAYLNDVEDGGETAFSSLGISYEPRRGDLLMFPANWVFSHEARAPRGNAKFCLVTWLHFDGQLAYEASALAED